jgi:hypothetical protein
MPSQQEYESVFRGIIEAGPPIISGSDREMKHIGATIKRELTKQRDLFTRGISAVWKEGHAALKSENDSLQFKLYKWFKVSQNDIWYKYPLVKGRRDPQASVEIKELHSERNSRVRGISQTWKDGFKKIKEENDSLQLSLRAAYKDAIEFTDARYEPE